MGNALVAVRRLRNPLPHNSAGVGEKQYGILFFVDLHLLCTLSNDIVYLHADRLKGGFYST